MKIYEYEMVPFVVCETPALFVGAGPRAVLQYMQNAFDKYPEQESFWIIALDRKNNIKGRTMITLGTQTVCLAHPREVFRAALMLNAVAIVCVHNHPSGDPAPSAPDVHVTRVLREGAKQLDIPLLDHVIIGDVERDPTAKGYFSFKESGLV